MSKEETAIIQADIALPQEIPLFPVQDKPLFPGVFTPLVIQKPHLVKMVERAIKQDGILGFVLTKDEEKEPTEVADLYPIGTVVKIIKRLHIADGAIHLFLAAISRFRCFKLLQHNQSFVGLVKYLPDEIKRGEHKEINALSRTIVADMRRVMDNNPHFNEELRVNMMNIDNPGKIADFVASVLNIDRKIQQEVLAITHVKTRLERVLVCIKRELELLKIQRKITREINEKIEKSQREYFLKEELKAIKQELGMPSDAKQSEYIRFSERFKSLNLRGEVAERITQELEKFQLIDKNSPEFQLTHNYLDTVLSLPWNTLSTSEINIEMASKILNRDHYKLDDVKERILEFIAVGILKESMHGSILCLVGPPGVGKTSLGRSIARALNKKFFRFSVGGMRDEAEIKGHRRTYIGAMPGKIIQGLKIVKEKNPVFMIDEIDKLGISYQGDPSSALLEVLDPEQNNSFRDHYLDVPFDISQVLFVTTANTTETIPSPLLDRMEIIRLSGYTNEEKAQIARRFLVPQSLTRAGLKKKDAIYNREMLLYIANNWARESGLRNYEKSLNKIHRKLARKVVTKKSTPPFNLTKEDIDTYLGKPTFKEEAFHKATTYGTALGLAWTPLGGAVLSIEAIANKGKGKISLTGQLGEVMQESAQIAYSYVRSITEESAQSDFYDTHHIHVHVPAGATKKDGPSAGITIATALLSLVLHRRIKSRLAMTGELSLTGAVLAIGGIKEKLIAAQRNNIKHVVFPQSNQVDVDELAPALTKGIKLHPIKDMQELLSVVWDTKK